MNSLQGHLLVASPYLGEPTFARTVVLLIQHNEEGAFGVVLNRPVGETIPSLWEKLGEGMCPIDRQINFGGPVSGPVVALHTDKMLGEIEIPPGIYLAAGKDHLEQLVQQNEHAFRLYIGHAGWGKGQLEEEIEQGVWLTIPAKEEQIFGDQEHLWKDSVRAIGRSIVQSALRLKHVPDDPSLN